MGEIYKDSHPTVALQFMKYAETNLGKVSEKPFRELPKTKLKIVSFLVESKNFADAKRVLDKVQPPKDEGLSIRYHYLKAFVHAKHGHVRTASRHFKALLKERSTRQLDDDFLMAMVSVLSKKSNKKYEKKVLEVLASRHPFKETGAEALAMLKQYASSNDTKYFFSMRLMRLMKLHGQIDQDLHGSLENFLELPVYRSRKKMKVLDPIEKAEFAMDMGLDHVAGELIERMNKKKRLVRKDKSRLLLAKARIAQRSNDRHEALKWLEEHREKYQRESLKEDLEMDIGNIHFREGRFAQAAAEYKRIAARTNKPFHRWKYFWSLYRGGNYKEAMKLLSTQGYVRGQDQARKGVEVIYWTGRILEKSGQLKEAASYYSKLLSDHSQSFYAMLLKARLSEVVVAQGHAQLPQTRLQLAINIGERFLGAIKAVPEAVLALKGDLKNQVNWKHAENPSIKNKKVLKKLVEFLKRPEVFRMSKREFVVEDIELSQDYPRSFSEIVDPLAESLNIDKYLTYSMMRQESRFNPDAVSYVGALGLMQIMPYTGLRIAKELDDFQFHYDRLKDPLVNVSYGQYYIKRLLDYYEDNTFMAVAAYNAGPTAVNRWLSACQACEIDEFIESIPYRETRRYVKKVFKNYAVYKGFYEEEFAVEVWPSVFPDHPDGEALF